MIIDEKLWNELIKKVNKLSRCYDNLDDDFKNTFNDVYYCIDKIEMTQANKVYVITNNAIVNDEIYYQLAGVAFDEKTTQKIFQEAIKNAKIDADFDNLDEIETGATYYYDQEGWMCEEDDKSFSLYLNGEYNSNNFSIEIKEYDISKSRELDKEESMEV